MDMKNLNANGDANAGLLLLKSKIKFKIDNVQTENTYFIFTELINSELPNEPWE